MIAILVDGNNQIGIGHYTRCLTIAKALIKEGKDVIFMCSYDSDLPCLYNKEVNYIVLSNSDVKPWDPLEIGQHIESLNVKLLIIDSYRIDNSHFAILKKFCYTVYIDDLNTYDCDVDCVVNFNLDAQPKKYHNQNFLRRLVFAGIKYYPIAEQLLRKRNRSIKRVVKKVMITSGSTDPKHCISKIIYGIDPLKYEQIEFILLKGLFFEKEYIDELNILASTYDNITLLEWGEQFIENLANVDLLITSGSSIALEALTMNVPCITYQFADNHNIECVELQSQNMADWAGIYKNDSFENTNNRMKRLFQLNLDYGYRLQKEKNYKSMFDGHGAVRLVKVLLDLYKKDSLCPRS